MQTFRNESEPWFFDRDVPRLGKYRLRGRVWGSGRPLYFLPGIGGTIDLFALLVFLLKDDFRCVLLDYPGSPAPETGETSGSRRISRALPRSTASTLADDLLAVADQCGDRTFDLFATSFGSLVALQAALRQPERISRLALQGAFAHRELSLAERGLVRLGSWLPVSLRSVPFRSAVQQQNHRRWFPPFDETRFAFYAENTGHVSVKALARRGVVLRDADLRPVLCKIEQPVLLIQGEGEGAVSERSLAELMTGTAGRAGLPNHRLERMHNVGQLPYLTHPHRIAKLLREFLQTPDQLFPPRTALESAAGDMRRA